MEDNKLYNALLKSQDERRRFGREHEETETDERYLKEPHRAISDLGDMPYGTRVQTNENERPPTVYDPSVSLALIGNPTPWSREQLRERKIIFSGMPDKEVMEAYRELRIQLRNRAGEGNFTVMYTSLGATSTGLLTAFNLAAAFALDSHTSALLVDCDPHSSELAGLVSCGMKAGVTDFVNDSSMPIKSILYPSGVDRLSVIPAGTHASSAVELFSSVRMRELIEELKARYPDRCIVLNAPPLRENTEARILERFADQIIFGVPFGEVTGDIIEDSVDAFGSDKFSGLVFQE